MAHAVVRTDLLLGTDGRSELVSVRYQPSGTMTEIDNGNLVKLGNLEAGSRTVYKGETPAASDTIADVVLIASPEIVYDERKYGLENFYNEKGTIARGYRLHEHDIFSVTAEAFNGTPELGKTVKIGAGTKIELATSGGFGAIIDKNVVGRYTYWVIEVGGDVVEGETGDTGDTGATGDTGNTGATG